MKSFKNNSTGVTLTPRNDWAEKQLANDNRFVEVSIKTPKEDTKKITKAPKEDTKDSMENGATQ